ncbi:uncharacterized protein CANTADRAFT_60526 [Suhomyces tanzawaensis NRRL Y-17324]|uniref:Tag1-like fifth Ig-like domain-containing protein n=1 Tax=Suhomyces tanzawaensis NRRL Y-17324 TaxID=984487 RepID=A0A1E4SS16_9ASCO|nr:uncharacterized protein CANTADRAFT_60526 [Suhomyces tanzawaensis NRRL Y-17324]ODV82300.1 hypothetical protein CANTADRAFT_60526 [Suhomyces tanzawaensis NRRL Y-17324]
MSKFYKKALNKLSNNSSSERSSDSESVDKTDKPRRSLSFRRRSRDKGSSRSQTSPRSSYDSSRLPALVDDTSYQVDIPEEPQEPTVSPVDVSVRIVDDESEPAQDQAPSEEPPRLENAEEEAGAGTHPILNSNDSSEGADVSNDLLLQPSSIHADHTHDSQDPKTSQVDETSTEPDTLLPEQDSELNAEPTSVKTTAGSDLENQATHHYTPITEEIVEELEPLLRATSSQSQFHGESVEASPGLVWSFLIALNGILTYLNPKRPKLVHLVIVLLILFSVLLYFLFTNLDTLVAQSVKVNLQSVSILKINDDGVDSHVTGSLLVDYDNISNVLYKSVLKLGAIFLGTLTIIPNQQIKIYVKPSSLDIAPLHLVDVYPPPLKVAIINKRETDIDFITKVNIIKDDALKLSHEFDKLRKIDGDSINFDVQGVFSSEIQTKFFNFNTDEINVYESLEIPKEILAPPIEVKKFDISTSEAVEIYTQIQLGGDIPLDLAVNGINWDVLLKDCDDNLIEFGDWKSRKFTIRPNKEVIVDIDGSITDIDDVLLYPCADGTDSPLNRIIQSYLSEEPIHFALRGSKQQDEKLPGWLYEILTNLEYEIEVTLPKGSLELGQYQLQLVEFEVPSSQSTVVGEDHLHMFFKSNLTLSVTYDVGLEFQIPSFKSNFTIKDVHSNDIIRGSSYNYNHLNINFVNESTMNIEVSLETMDLQVFDPEKAGQLLNKFVEDGFVVPYDQFVVDLEVNELSFELNLFKTRLNKLRVNNITLINKQDEFAVQINENASRFEPEEELPPIDSFLNLLNISIASLLYEDSYNDGVVIVCDFAITNPSNFSLDLPGELLLVGLDYNGTSFAKVRFEDLYIPANERFNTTAEVELSADGVDSKIRLEQLLGAFISGYDDLEVKVFNLTAKNKGLNKILQEVEISGIRIPNIEFNRPPSADLRAATPRPTHPSPFLVESVIHVLNSEVQLKLLNPIENAELVIDLYQAEATSEDKVLGHLERPELLVVTPGVYQTPRIPIKIARGIGMDTLRKAINGDLEVDVVAVFKVRLDKFESELVYRGHGLKSQIRF